MMVMVMMMVMVVAVVVVVDGGGDGDGDGDGSGIGGGGDGRSGVVTVLELLRGAVVSSDGAEVIGSRHAPPRRVISESQKLPLISAA